MKKLILVLILLSLTGCGKKDVDTQVDNKDDNKISKEDLLKSEMRTVYSNPEELLIEEKVGKLYYTTLKTTAVYAANSASFEGCDNEKTGYSIMVMKRDEIYAIYKIYLNCDGKSIIYTYDDLSEDSEPVGMVEKEI